MIQPEEIIDKAHRLYAKAIAAQLSGQIDFFPYRMPCSLKAPESQAELIRSVEGLRQRSKQVVGYGYSVTYVPRRSRDHGTNDFPDAIIIDSMEDLVRLIRKSTEYSNLKQAVNAIRERLPELESWIVESWRKLLAITDPINDLIEVCFWLRENPRPGIFPREIPLAISSKLVENNWSLLAAWWDRILPASAIDYSVDARDYAQRYGFRAVEPHLLVRLLDPDLEPEMGMPVREFSVAAAHLDQLLKRTQNLKQVVIVENKVNLLTLPQRRHSLALGGLGFGVTQLRQLFSLASLDLVYWGDMDVEGFQALSSLRTYFPSIRSWLMDLDAMHSFMRLAITGNDAKPESPANLSASELEAFIFCRDHNLRLEQERITQAYIQQRWSELDR